MEPTRIFDLLDRMNTLYPNKEDILARKKGGKWHKISVKQYTQNSHHLASAFISLGLEKEDKIITICSNRPEWNFIDMACGLAGMVHVPVYPTLSNDDYLHIFKHKV